MILTVLIVVNPYVHTVRFIGQVVSYIVIQRLQLSS